MAAVLSVLRRALRVAVETIFPLECLSCGRAGRFCCPDCLATIPSLAPSGAVGGLAGLCMAYPYARPLLRRLIKDWKYRDFSGVGEAVVVLVERWVMKHATVLTSVGIIVAVPLHRDRLRERGFNQADVIAKTLGRSLGRPVAPPEALRRLLRTRPQADLRTSDERSGNVAGAFVADPAVFAGASVLLVDDVCTTGSTLFACAAALRRAGAERVTAFTLAGALHRKPKPLK